MRAGVQEFWWRTFNSGGPRGAGAAAAAGGGWWSTGALPEVRAAQLWALAQGQAFGAQRWPRWVEDPPAEAGGGGQRGGEGWGCLPGAEGEGGGSTETHPQSGKGPGTGHWCQTRGTALARKWPKNGTACQFPLLRAHAPAPRKRPRAGVSVAWVLPWCLADPHPAGHGARRLQYSSGEDNLCHERRDAGWLKRVNLVKKLRSSSVSPCS